MHPIDSETVDDNTLDTSPVDISVVVCTYNRPQMLRDTLRSLCQQRTDNGFRYEIVVIDNASTDDTPEVIRSVAAEVAVPFRGLREERQGVSFARNRGIEAARGEWIAFCDDDEIARPDWLSKLKAMADQRQVRVVGGGLRLLLPDCCPADCHAVYARALGHSGQATAPHAYSARQAPGAGNIMIHRSVFEAVGTFDTALSEAAEDTDLFLRITAAGFEAWYTPDAIVEHQIPDYRTSDAYLQWMSWRHGWSLARQDRALHGALGVSLRALARLGQALLIHAPLALGTRWRKGPAAAIYRRCRLWRATGYVRGTLKCLAPRWCAQQQFYEGLNFRHERQQFDAGPSSEMREQCTV